MNEDRVSEVVSSTDLAGMDLLDGRHGSVNLLGLGA